MGRIKTTLIKRVTKELFKKYGADAKDEFSSQKKFVGNHITATSKKTRNIIAGYSVRLAKKNKQ